jgi:hypothetical protein
MLNLQPVTARDATRADALTTFSTMLLRDARVRCRSRLRYRRRGVDHG